MPKSKQSGKNQRGFAATDIAMQREIANLKADHGRGAPNPLPSRDASQSSSKAGVRKNATDASSPGVSLGKTSKHSHRRS